MTQMNNLLLIWNKKMVRDLEMGKVVLKILLTKLSMKSSWKDLKTTSRKKKRSKKTKIKAMMTRKTTILK
jgi:hypothetical protein